ncbi:transposase family protein [Streptomyces tritici]|uniref:transposase family protein n=1 Tax=Streptomyces tritici TaxID=2054410 RepID=UPI003AF16695
MIPGQRGRSDSSGSWKLPSIADVAVLSVDVNAETLRVDAQCIADGAVCPVCGAWSNRIHGSYLQFPADVPSGGRSVVLQLKVRRFACGNPGIECRHRRRRLRPPRRLASTHCSAASSVQTPVGCSSTARHRLGCTRQPGLACSSEGQR